MRNLTSWEDPDASRLVFAVGNALFAFVLFGRVAIVMLWLSFIGAFTVPLFRDRPAILEELPPPADAIVAAISDKLRSFRLPF